MDTPALAAAQYLRRGWSVIPIEPRGKRPLIRWHAFQARRATHAEVEVWYRRWPAANVGVVTGAISGLVVLDVDAAHGGEQSLARLEGSIGSLPLTVQACTGGGGHHHYFAHPGITVRNRVGVLPGIDLRGDGGCVVAPPSIHPCGRPYEWVRGRSPDELALARLPEGLVAPTGGQSWPVHSTMHWRELVRVGVVEGQRNSTIASLAGHLLRHGIDERVVLELLLCWNRTRCDPPLDDEEVSRVVTSIGRLHRVAEQTD